MTQHCRAERGHTAIVCFAGRTAQTLASRSGRRRKGGKPYRVAEGISDNPRNQRTLTQKAESCRREASASPRRQDAQTPLQATRISDEKGRVRRNKHQGASKTVVRRGRNPASDRRQGSCCGANLVNDQFRLRSTTEVTQAWWVTFCRFFDQVPEQGGGWNGPPAGSFPPNRGKPDHRHGRSRRHRRSQSQQEPQTRTGHKAEDHRATCSACARLPLPSAQARPARKARHRPPPPQRGNPGQRAASGIGTPAAAMLQCRPAMPTTGSPSSPPMWNALEEPRPSWLALGWSVEVIWECETRKQEVLAAWLQAPLQP